MATTYLEPSSTPKKVIAMGCAFWKAFRNCKEMLRTRIIPCLQMINGSLVKTIKFRNHRYIGDPVNTVRIFNELEMDELCFLDIRVYAEKREPDYELLAQIAEECFMPLSYGGGIKTVEAAHRILTIGFEKVIVNTHAFENPDFIRELVNTF